MTQRNGAAMHIDFLAINTKLFAISHRHGPESLIDFEQINIINRQSGFIQSTLGGGDGSFQHNDRIVTHDRQMDDFGQRLYIEFFQTLFIDNHHA